MARKKKEAETEKVMKAPKSGGIGINAEHLKHMRVADKFSMVFNRVTIIMLIASAALVITVIYDMIQYNTMYTKYLSTVEIASNGAESMQSLSKNTLYIVAAEEQSVKMQRMDIALGDAGNL